MRKASILAAAAFIGLIILAGAAQAAEKYGYVELGKIFSEYKKTVEYDKALASKEEAFNTERDKKVNEVKQFQDKMDLLSDKEKEAKKSEFEAKVKALQEFDRQQQTDLRKEFSDKKAEIIKDIDAVIKQYAEKEGYTIIFNEAGVVYNVKSMDITDKILEALNKNYKQ